MSGNGKDAVAEIISNLKSKRGREPTWITFARATDDIAQALNLPHDASAMMLHGLCATGNVRALNSQHEVIDLDECTIADFEGQHAFIDANALRDCINEWTTAPQRLLRDHAIETRLKAGEIPGRTIPWKSFCDRIRRDCKVTRHSRGYTDKTISRAVRRFQQR
jgi:hypothetical protein